MPSTAAHRPAHRPAHGPSARPRRAKYADWQKDLVRTKYPLCRTTRDKEALCAEAGISTLHKMYNLASRLGVTRTHHDGLVGADNDNGGELYDATTDASRLTLRESPADTVFNDADDTFLRENFGSQTIEQIAFRCEHTTTAMSYRARILGLRRPTKWWPAEQVEAWLSLAPADWAALQAEGLELAELTGRSGKVVKRLVSTISLGRWLTQGARWQRLVSELGADEFFIRDVIESIDELRKQATRWEGCAFLSAGHVCMNPRAGISMGLFCPNNERYDAGRDPNCDEKDKEIKPLRTPIAPRSEVSAAVPASYAPRIALKRG